MQKHELECLFKPQPCPDCSEMINPDKMEKHRSEVCRFRKDQCEYCGKKLIHHKMQVSLLFMDLYLGMRKTYIVFLLDPLIYRIITKAARSTLCDVSIVRMKYQEKMYALPTCSWMLNFNWIPPFLHTDEASHWWGVQACEVFMWWSGKLSISWCSACVVYSKC